MAPDQDYLKSILRYDFQIGRFFWIVARGTRGIVGNMAGNLDPDGYRSISIDGKNFKEHRLVWLYVNGEMPKDQIDHVNHIRDDNRIENLRVVSNQENSRNVTMRNNNTTGVMGVCRYKRDNRWRACINVDGKTKHLGYFEDFFEAICARKSAEPKNGFHENHGAN